MNDQHSEFASSAICHAAEMVTRSWQEAAWEQQRPCVMFKPTLSKDGNMWCALFGDDLQVGVAGFGPRPIDAMWAFDQAWSTESGSHIIPRKEPTP